jgi:hypothetical protein
MCFTFINFKNFSLKLSRKKTKYCCGKHIPLNFSFKRMLHVGIKKKPITKLPFNRLPNMTFLPFNLKYYLNKKKISNSLFIKKKKFIVGKIDTVKQGLYKKNFLGEIKNLGYLKIKIFKRLLLLCSFKKIKMKSLRNIFKYLNRFHYQSTSKSSTKFYSIRNFIKHRKVDSNSHSRLSFFFYRRGNEAKQREILDYYKPSLRIRKRSITSFRLVNKKIKGPDTFFKKKKRSKYLKHFAYYKLNSLRKLNWLFGRRLLPFIKKYVSCTKNPKSRYKKISYLNKKSIFKTDIRNFKKYFFYFKYFKSIFMSEELLPFNKPTVDTIYTNNYKISFKYPLSKKFNFILRFSKNIMRTFKFKKKKYLIRKNALVATCRSKQWSSTCAKPEHSTHAHPTHTHTHKHTQTDRRTQ